MPPFPLYTPLLLLQAQDFIEDQMTAHASLVKELGNFVCEVSWRWAGGGVVRCACAVLRCTATAGAHAASGGILRMQPPLPPLLHAAAPVAPAACPCLQLKRVGQGHGVFHFDDRIDKPHGDVLPAA